MPRAKKVVQSSSVSEQQPRYKRVYARTSTFIRRRPVTSMLLALALLFVLLIVGSILQQPTEEKPKETAVKAVQVFRIGESPKATFQAKVEKTGVIKIMAQAPGIVQTIHVKEGQKLGKGQHIVSLSSNYQGGNPASVQRQIAQTQYQNAVDTYGLQKELVQKQRDVAATSAENADKQQEIARQSNDETTSLINAQQGQLDRMHQALQQFQNMSPSADVTQDDIAVGIAELEAAIPQAQGGLNQLKSAQRSLELQAGDSNPPAKLADLQKDIALKQLDIQEKSLAMNKEISRLQVNLAYVSEAAFFPASPFAGVVERVYVRKGQSVTPGTPLASITSTDVQATAVLQVPESVAKLISQGEPSELLLGEQKVPVTPYYVSSEATDGQLYAIFYDIPQEYQDEVSDSEYIAVNVPVDAREGLAATAFIPVDVVYQTQESAFVLVASGNKAVTKKVKLGDVFGDYVEVLSGLTAGDKVITDRTVVAGDKIRVH